LRAIRPAVTCIILLAAFLAWAPADAQITYVATSVSTLSSNTVYSITVNEPNGLAVGDLLIGEYTENAFPTTGLSGGAPSGWTVASYLINGSLAEAVIYRVATSADVGTNLPVTITFTAAGRGAGTILAFRGVATATPLGANGNQYNASATTRTAPAETPGVAGTMLLAFYAVANGTTDTLSNPTGMTQDLDVSTQFGSSGLLIGAFHELLSATTTTGTLVTTSGAAISAVSIGTTVVLLPAVGTPKALWHLDDASWSGVAGEVVDSSGNRYGGTAVHGASTTGVSPAIAGTTGTCVYGAFNGSTQYLQMPTSLPHVGNTFTVTAWIRPTAVQIGRVWADDLQFNGYALSFDDIGGGTFRFYSRSPSLVSVDSVAVLAVNTWYFVAGVMDATTAHTMTLYIYSANGTLLDTESGARTTFSPGTGPYATIGGSADASYEGAVHRFAGNIDEVVVYLNALTATQVQAAAVLTHACPSTVFASSFHITTSSYGIYCLPQAVTVAVRDASGNAFPSFAGTINLSTTTGLGTWSLTSGGGTLTAAANNGLATYTFPGNQSAAVFALSYTSGPTTVTVDAAQSSPTVITDDGTQGAMVFSPSGFTVTSSPFTNPAAGVATFASPQIAGTAFSLYLTAYGISPTSNTCGIITTYTGPKNINFWSTYVNPATGTLAATINGTAVATAEASSTAQSLTFTSGQATVSANYQDAGSLSVSLKDATTTGNPNLTTGIRGSTGTYVSQPANFVVSNIKRTSTGFANPAATGASGTVFLPAGQPFTATVVAVTSGGSATPNFGKETPAEWVKFGTALVLPTSGDASAITGTFTGFSGGAATGTAFSWAEVGIVSLIPRIGDGSYLGSGDIVGTATGNVGRFIPNNFAVVQNTPLFAAACPAAAGGFTYVGQSMLYAVAPVITATAQALSGSTTSNYTGALFKLTNTSLTGRSYVPTPASPALNVAGLPATTADPAIVDLGAGSAGSAGTATLTFGAGTGISFTRGSAIAPFNANIALSINVIDSDGAAASNPVTFGASTGIAFNSGIGAQYYGRLAVRNALGSELLDLPTPLTVQYYVSATQGFTTNLQDSCSAAPANAFSAYQAPLAAGETCVRDSGKPGVSGAGCAVAAPSSTALLASASAGNFNLFLAAPGIGNSGAVTVTATAPTWLQYWWNYSSGSNSSPSALATFGVFPGPASRIYEREVY
jgi:MSHA biogenesis protein MshQ